MRDLDFHENLVRRERLKTGSDRSFGLFFAVFCLIVSVSTLWKGDGQVNALVIGSSSCSMAFLTLALLRPGLLAPANRLWMRFGRLLSRVVNPVVLAVAFVSAVMPTGWFVRLFVKDPLNLRIDPKARSYWIKRRPPGPTPESSLRQF